MFAETGVSAQAAQRVPATEDAEAALPEAGTDADDMPEGEIQPGTGGEAEDADAPEVSDDAESMEQPGADDAMEDTKKPDTGDDAEAGNEPGTDDGAEDTDAPGADDGAEDTDAPGTDDGAENGNQPQQEEVFGDLIPDDAKDTEQAANDELPFEIGGTDIFAGIDDSEAYCIAVSYKHMTLTTKRIV